ncbi:MULTISPECIES: cell division protein ZapA [unclassified Psychrobacter]|uniref:cell division protein ZapA n=1 Tax=unclassified Psychrobacter TaxID=196806 RepID=UPI003FD3F579
MTNAQSDVAKTKTDQELQKSDTTKNDDLKTQHSSTSAPKIESTDKLMPSSQAPSQHSKPQQPAPKEPQIKKVDIAIAGNKYPIYCPVHEEEELRAAVSYINNYALDLKAEAPNLSQENLLVLCCLNLYEKINTNNKVNDARHDEDKKAEGLLNKIIKDAQSVL